MSPKGQRDNANARSAFGRPSGDRMGEFAPKRLAPTVTQ